MLHELRSQIAETTSLAEEEFDLVLSHFREKKFKKNQYLIQEGNAVQYEFFVVKGLVKGIRSDDTGKEFIVQFALEGNWITDQQAFHLGHAAMLSVIALEDTTVLMISVENRELVCKAVPKMEHFFRKKATHEFIESQKRVFCMISSTAKSQYYHFTRQNPELLRRVPKTLIAAYLGVSRETLSRLSETVHEL